MDQLIQEGRDRWVAFWKREMPGQILATVGAPRSRTGPSPRELYIKEHNLDPDTMGGKPPVFEEPERLFELYEATFSGPVAEILS